ncbi:MAG: hypothetical protein E7432_03340 [Ruminococcaceae bacterium]|nr:hypothetical protein [Oscillospiraceae bacterium]
MKKYILPTTAVIIVLIIFFRPAGFINTKGDGKVDIAFETARINAYFHNVQGESYFAENKIAVPYGIVEVIKNLKPVCYVESMGLGDYYKIHLDDGENCFEVMFYIDEGGINETAAVRKVNESLSIEWTWECKIADVEKVNEILN